MEHLQGYPDTSNTDNLKKSYTENKELTGQW